MYNIHGLDDIIHSFWTLINRFTMYFRVKWEWRRQLYLANEGARRTLRNNYDFSGCVKDQEVKWVDRHLPLNSTSNRR